MPIHRVSVAALLAPAFVVATLLLWSAYFLNLLAVFFFSSWLPVLTSASGHTARQAIVAGAALWAGGIAGTLSLGWAIDRYGFGRLLASTYLVATLGIVATGYVMRVFPAALVTISIVGFCIMGAQAALNAFAATLYPTSIRTTGMGWALGIGRLGSIAGPVIGGQLIGLRLPTETLFIAAAIPTALAMLVVLPMRPRDAMHADAAAAAATSSPG
ncbi:MFS transporter [Burkholderia ambifaria]|uniref:MFS transporter n=1 Tax=Burkholderia ambifaria TaxID=152480 RepID=UPI00158E70D5|nr:MFS transporter [Burkholderia ambifaria]